MQALIKLLDDALVERIIGEGLDLLHDPGVKVYSDQGLALLADSGADVDFETTVARIPQPLVERAFETAPSEFVLYDGDGNIAVRYEGDHVHFDPGSFAVNILDGKTGEHRKPITADYVHYAQLTEMLPAYDAISTAFVCSDVVEDVGDLYRLYLTLLYCKKPVVTGAFRTDTLHLMKDLLAIDAGGIDRLAAKPRAVFDVCPSPPLLWSELACQNLIDLARYRIPAEIVSMPLAGSTAPVTLVDVVVQHTAECMSGVVIHQLASLGVALARSVGHHGEFLSQKHTRSWFAREQHIPSDVVDRGSLTGWRNSGGKTTRDRASDEARKLLAAYESRSLSDEVRRALRDITERAAFQAGMDHLPPLHDNVR
jgi:trimethylamine--corrinoid protein Co-methyltransferase